jgi:predicted phage terminase large subunit-like protein
LPEVMTLLDYTNYLVTLLAEILPRHPAEITARLQDCPLIGPDSVRKLLGEIDTEFFARAYFPEYFEYPVPDFHREAYAELDAMLNKAPCGTRKVRAWPRSNAKSTIYNFFAPCKAALYGLRNFIVQGSDSESQAQGFLGDVKSAIETNPYVLEDFGDVRGAVWRADMINIRSSKNSDVWLAAIGAGSSVRGLRKGRFRPDYITLDDAESDDSVLTPDRITKLMRWFNRALMNLGTATTDIIVVGTVLAYESLLDQLLKSPTWDAKKYSAIIKWSTSPLWDNWRKIYTDLSLTKDERNSHADAYYKAHEEELLEGTEVLWPTGKPYKTLMETYTTIGEAAFWAEHQNDPVNLDECIFKHEWITYYDNDELKRTRIVATYGALDPSLGKTKLADYTAFIIIGQGENGFMYVLDAIVERMNPDKILDTLMLLGKTYNFTRFGIEVNQWQDLLRVMFIERSARQNIYLPIVELRHNKDKVIRVQSLIPYIKNGYVKFNREHRLLMEQLLGFPKLRHDDACDCLEMAVRMVSRNFSDGEPIITGTYPTNKHHRYSSDDYDDRQEVHHYYS